MNKLELYKVTKKISKYLLAFPLLGVLLSPFAQSAAEEKPPALAEIWAVDVKPGMQGEFEKAFKKHVAFREESGDPRGWQIYNTHTGRHLNQYLIRYCCFKWSERDAYEKWNMESGASENWNKNVDKFTEGYDHKYQWIDHKNSNWPRDKSYKFVGVRTFKLKAGNNIGDSVKEISKMAKDMDWERNWAWVYSVSGKDEVKLAFPYESFADMTPPDPSFGKVAAEHLGSEDKVKEMFDKFDSNFKASYYTIYQHRPDLSMKGKK